MKFINGHARVTVISVVLALVAVAAMVIALLFFTIRTPEYPTVAGNTINGLGGTVAFLRQAPAAGKQCLTVVNAASGQATDLTCDITAPGFDVVQLAWSEDGKVLVIRTDSTLDSTKIYQYDVVPNAKPKTYRSVADAAERVEPSKQLTIVEGRHVAAVKDARNADLFRVDKPSQYSFSIAVSSPDANWVGVADSLDRVIIYDNTGHRGRLLYKAATTLGIYGVQLTWFQPGRSENTLSDKVLNTTPEKANLLEPVNETVADLKATGSSTEATVPRPSVTVQTETTETSLPPVAATSSTVLATPSVTSAG